MATCDTPSLVREITSWRRSSACITCPLPGGTPWKKTTAMYRNREWIKIHTTRKCCNFSFVFLTTYDKVYMPRPGRFLGRTPLPALASCLTIWLAFFFIRTLKLGGTIVSRFYPIRVSSVTFMLKLYLDIIMGRQLDRLMPFWQPANILHSVLISMLLWPWNSVWLALNF